MPSDPTTNLVVSIEVFRRLRALLSDFDSPINFDAIRRGHSFGEDLGFDALGLEELAADCAKEFADLHPAGMPRLPLMTTSTVGEVIDALVGSPRSGSRLITGEAQKLRIMGIHGLGDHRGSDWKQLWTEAILQSVPSTARDRVEVEFIEYDPIFEHTHIDALEFTTALAKLLSSGVGSLFRKRSKGMLGTPAEKVRWTAGYVVAWLEDESFQEKTRKLFYQRLEEFRPDILLAHSLGSLISYDALQLVEQHPSATRSAATTAGKLTYVTLGSQLNNPFVSGNLAGGRLKIPPVARWFHLFNRHDSVFTAPIHLSGDDRFQQIDTPFDEPNDLSNHNPVRYITHGETASDFWNPFLTTSRGKVPIKWPALPKSKRQPEKRALLVGINEYPSPDDRLEGCVNDVFLMSSILQECGFAPDQIRICLNERATADGIVDRLEWLLHDTQPDDQLVFYYSGHGAQLATYGAGDSIDRMDETLVPYDFDWSPERCVTDDQIYALYSQLPYATRLAMIFDCCHSGGIHRAGAPRARGINPPDDIRHRSMKWDSNKGRWLQREMTPINPDFSSDSAATQRYCGTNCATYRLGRAMGARVLSEAEYTQRDSTENGPYLPLILEACREEELAFEYRDGAASYGAFTFTLSRLLRQHRSLTFQDLVTRTRESLSEMGYNQEPQILGPRPVVESTVPWNLASHPPGAPTRRRRRSSRS